MLETGAGDATVFDIRVQHAGGANRSTGRRPLLYHVYARPWYTLPLHVRLLEEGGFAEPGKVAERLFRLRGEGGSAASGGLLR